MKGRFFIHILFKSHAKAFNDLYLEVKTMFQSVLALKTIQ